MALKMTNNLAKSLKTTGTSQIAIFAAGCFWGVEHIYLKTFKSRILDTEVGYANGTTENPTYEQVCTGKTNFAESLKISFEPNVISYKELVEFFFKIHDPTTLNSQGPDTGTQYRSAIFTVDNEQFKIANEVKDFMQKNWYPNDPIVTKIEPIKNFYNAETYHQKYLTVNPSGYECPTHFIRTGPK